MRCGGFSIDKYRKPRGICCDLCPKCYNEIRDAFIKCELKEDENDE